VRGDRDRRSIRVGPGDPLTEYPAFFSAFSCLAEIALAEPISTSFLIPLFFSAFVV
jgi:hypothetical protein